MDFLLPPPIDGSCYADIHPRSVEHDYTTALRAAHPEVSMHRSRMVNRELGIACGKPFSVSTITVLDAGDSDLMALESNLE